jgi:hypothetical protein
LNPEPRTDQFRFFFAGFATLREMIEARPRSFRPR